MSPALVEAKLAWQPIVLIKTREARLMVFMLEALPTELALQFIFGLRFYLRHQVKRVVHLHAQYFLIPNLVNQNIYQWKIINGLAVTAFRPNITE